MVIGVDTLAQAFAGQGGQDLVHVHVGRGARTGLVDIDGELPVPVALGHLEGGGGDGAGHVGADHAQGRVLKGGGPLEEGQAPDQGPFDGLAGHGEVVDGALGLSLPLGAGRDVDLAHGVVLDPVVGVLAGPGFTGAGI